MTQVALQDAVGPTGMSDAVATMMGLKSYSHGTTYTGSPNSPTVTLVAGGGSLVSLSAAIFLPYQLQDGTWRMKINIDLNLSAVSRTSATLGIAGVVFFNTGNSGQAVSGGTVANAFSTLYAYAVSNAGQIYIQHPSGTTVEYTISGDVALASKPSWAY